MNVGHGNRIGDRVGQRSGDDLTADLAGRMHPRVNIDIPQPRLQVGGLLGTDEGRANDLPGRRTAR